MSVLKLIVVALLSLCNTAASENSKRQECPVAYDICDGVEEPASVIPVELPIPSPPPGHVLVNGTTPVPPPPPIPQIPDPDTTNTTSENGTNIVAIPVSSGISITNTTASHDAEDQTSTPADPNSEIEIFCPAEIKPLIRNIIYSAALLAGAGAKAASAGNTFPFNFFFPGSSNETVGAILSRAEQTLSGRGVRVIYSCHDWSGPCKNPNVRAFAGERNYHRPDPNGGVGHDEIVNLVTLCTKTIAWPANHWPCSGPPTVLDTPAHIVLHEVLHFQNITLGSHIGDVVYGVDACHALLVNTPPGIPGPEHSSDCFAMLASYAWDLGFGRDEGTYGWRGVPCPEKWGPPISHKTMITLGP